MGACRSVRGNKEVEGPSGHDQIKEFHGIKSWFKQTSLPPPLLPSHPPPHTHMPPPPNLPNIREVRSQHLVLQVRWKTKVPCVTSIHQLIVTSIHQLIVTSIHQLIVTRIHQLIVTSINQLIVTSIHQLIVTSIHQLMKSPFLAKFHYPYSLKGTSLHKTCFVQDSQSFSNSWKRWK